MLNKYIPSHYSETHQIFAQSETAVLCGITSVRQSAPDKVRDTFLPSHACFPTNVSVMSLQSVTEINKSAQGRG